MPTTTTTAKSSEPATNPNSTDLEIPAAALAVVDDTIMNDIVDTTAGTAAKTGRFKKPKSKTAKKPLTTEFLEPAANINLTNPEISTTAPATVKDITMNDTASTTAKSGYLKKPKNKNTKKLSIIKSSDPVSSTNLTNPEISVAAPAAVDDITMNDTTMMADTNPKATGRSKEPKPKKPNKTSTGANSNATKSAIPAAAAADDTIINESTTTTDTTTKAARSKILKGKEATIAEMLFGPTANPEIPVEAAAVVEDTITNSAATKKKDRIKMLKEQKAARTKNKIEKDSSNTNDTQTASKPEKIRDARRKLKRQSWLDGNKEAEFAPCNGIVSPTNELSISAAQTEAQEPAYRAPDPVALLSPALRDSLQASYYIRPIVMSSAASISKLTSKLLKALDTSAQVYLQKGRKPEIVAVTARATTANKAMSCVEIAKRDVLARGDGKGMWIYCSLSSQMEETKVRKKRFREGNGNKENKAAEKDVEMGDGAVKKTVDRDAKSREETEEGWNGHGGEGEEEAFETMQPTNETRPETKVRAVPVLTIWMARFPVQDLKFEFGEQSFDPSISMDI